MGARPGRARENKPKMTRAIIAAFICASVSVYLAHTVPFVSCPGFFLLFNGGFPARSRLTLRRGVKIRFLIRLRFDLVVDLGVLMRLWEESQIENVAVGIYKVIR